MVCHKGQYFRGNAGKNQVNNLVKHVFGNQPPRCKVNGEMANTASSDKTTRNSKLTS